MTKLTCALIQMTSSLDRDKNIQDVADLIRLAASKGPDYIQTPEMTNFITNSREELMERILPEGKTPEIPFFQSLAKELGIWLHIGSMAVLNEAGSPVNRGYLFTPEGELQATYDKIHMFDVQISEQDSYKESATYQAGEKAVIAPMGEVKLGLSICYDLRFPHLYRHMAKRGADMLAVPAAFTQPTGKAHWMTLLRSRAIECGAFVLAAAQTGEHECGRKTYGHSAIIDPWGQVLAEAETYQGVLQAEIDLSEVTKVRQQIPSLANNQEFD